MDAVIEYPTLEHIAQQARPYPVELLKDAESGLCLYAAAYAGHNDAIHFALEKVPTICVDTDETALWAMEFLYPRSWQFVWSDAWEYAELAEKPTADVVSVDCFTGDEEARVLGALELWASLARKAVTITATDELYEQTEPPAGWRKRRYVRAPDVNWLVLERDE
jgi:hypothetical protein